ncbi:MAG TPA: hypothetical protein VML75_14695 [Kofleriaceae bacterium]|nr:hypothetical protein [Kofleriaceae bacterium]
MLVMAFGLIAATGDARANKVSKELEDKVKQAMEAFDGFEYEQARQILNSAVLLAKKNKVTGDKALAKVHLSLGIVYFSGFEEPESAKLAFLEALQIDPGITVGESYRTKEMDAMIETLRSEVGGEPLGDPPAGGGDADDVDCDSIEGIQHKLVDEAAAGSDTAIAAHVSPSIAASKVVLFYRPKGSTDFAEAKMKKAGGCTYRGTIPGKAFADEFVHYYIAAMNDGGKALASRGSAGLPNIIEVSGGSSAGDDDDDSPFGTGGSITKPGGPSKKKSSVFLAVAVGSGGGYVNGDTEEVGSAVQCCFAPALLHLFPEIGYFFSAQTSISAAFRMGFPVGANREGHATAAPAGFLRIRHALAPTGEGFLINGSLGGGIIRHTVALTGVADMKGDVDTVASGPLFIGTGAGYGASLGGPVRLVAELNVLAGLPVAKLDDVEPGFAIQLDANLGLLFAF